MTDRPAAGEGTARDQATIATLRDQLRDQRRETQHQVRNLLSIIRSIARRTVVDGESAEEYQARLDTRISSIARVQGHVLRYPDKGVDLGTLVAGELMAFGVQPGSGAELDGRALSLKPRPAAVLGLAFHELARLTIEGGRAGSAGGATIVRWWTDAGDRDPAWLVIEWRDTGRDLDARSLADSAFAQDMLEQAIPYQLKGEVAVDLDGGDLRCVIRLPVDDLFFS